MTGFGVIIFEFSLNNLWSPFADCTWSFPNLACLLVRPLRLCRLAQTQKLAS